jgi:hypothetical protein
MAYASRAGKARVSAKKPSAFFVCDRCGFWGNRCDAQFQADWRGGSLQNLWLLVCRRCLDTPQEQNRAVILPADPVPIWQPRPENFADAETDYRSTVSNAFDPIVGIPIPSTTLRVTEDCQNRITQPIGSPAGLEQNAVMPYNGGVQKAFGVVLPILSVIANGTATITVTCSKVHGLHTDGQISAEGLTAANGFYSVTVISATAFSYLMAGNVPAASLLTPTSRIVTALVGLQYGAQQIQPEGRPSALPTRQPAPAVAPYLAVGPNNPLVTGPGGEEIIL